MTEDKVRILHQREDGKFVECSEHQITILFDTEDQLKKFIDNQKRYRWHNLKKDPEDLPDISNDTGEYYEVVQLNHENDIPRMNVQYCEGLGFGFWEDIYDSASLGYVDSEFRTLEEYDLEPVVAWREIEPYDDLIGDEEEGMDDE